MPEARYVIVADADIRRASAIARELVAATDRFRNRRHTMSVAVLAPRPNRIYGNHRVELGLVNLTPKVKRTDAIQSFVSQETPMVRVFDRDGAIGTGYSYTIGTGGSAIVALLRDHLAPLPPVATPNRSRQSGAVILHACDVGRRDHLARAAAVDTALWTSAAGAPSSCFRSPAAPRLAAAVHHRRRMAASRARRAGRRRARGQGAGFGGAKIKIGRPHVAEDVARLARSAARSAPAGTS
jgi:L-alanine-DL-glutamate epimerase-like enolase superfamily enzyme